MYFPTSEVGFKATIILKDKTNDLALLKLQDFKLSMLGAKSVPYGIGQASDIALGSDVFTIGFPLSVVLGQSAKVSSGTVNSLSGLDDDPRLLQISNPVQPGNSGGPLFNKDGNLIGVVVASLNASYFYERAKILPQNVNFAVKIDYLRNLISMLPNGKGVLERTSTLKGKSIEEQVRMISPFVASIKSRK